MVYLADGRVVDHGTHQELLERRPGYADLVNAYEQAAAERAAETDTGESDERRVSR